MCTPTNDQYNFFFKKKLSYELVKRNEYENTNLGSISCILRQKTVWVYILHFTAPPRLGRGKMTEPVENKRGKNKI